MYPNICSTDAMAVTVGGQLLECGHASFWVVDGDIMAVAEAFYYIRSITKVPVTRRADEKRIVL